MKIIYPISLQPTERDGGAGPGEYFCSVKRASLKSCGSVSFLRSQHALTLLGASVRLCRNRDSLKLSIPGVSITIKVYSNIIFCSPTYFPPPASAGGAWGPNQLLPCSTPGVLMYLSWERITGRYSLLAALADSLPLQGPAHPQPQDKLFTELISSPQQPPPACTSYPQLPG